MGRETDKIYRFSVDPTVNDDSSLNYELGDEWLNAVSKELFECLDDTNGAAVWKSKFSVLINGATIIGDGAVLLAPAIGSNQNDYNPVGFQLAGVIQISFLVVEPSGNYNLTGLEAPFPAIRNRVLIFNNGGGTMTLVNNSGLSLATNRFSLKNNITIQQQESIEVVYALSLSRWIALDV